MTEKTIHVSEIRSGDLLAWKRDNFSWFSQMALRIVKWLTGTPWGHVGIAWRIHDGLGDGLFVIEATIPKIKVSRVDPRQEVFCVQAGVTWTEKGKQFLLEKIELPYGLMDAIRALFGLKVEKDEKWQCAELSHAYYQTEGLVLPEELKPASLIKNLEKATGNTACRIIHSSTLNELDSISRN